MKRWVALYLSVLGVLGCGSAYSPSPSETTTGTTTEPLAGATASGSIPAGLPARVSVGLFEDSGQTWMKSSGVNWDARYRYFTKGWVNNWGYGAYDGSWGLSYLQESSSEGYLPAVAYYQIDGEAGGGESAMLQKVQAAGTMSTYFGDFKILMQRVKDFGKPALILVEADGFGFLEQQSGGNSNTYAAVADSGVPELAGLPNTVAGWGLAFLRLRASVGASNAVLGIHVSAWASGKDIAYSSVTDALQPEVDTVYSFLAPFGLSSNVTGQTYDVLVGDPLDRDSDYYRLVENQNRWWDASDTASVSSASFNRYAQWLTLWNQRAGKRWVLWQIPLGNSNAQNVYNNGSPAQGYKDNRPEYFFLNGTAHLQKFADAGVISLLFGAGAGGQSSYENDTYTDGQLFMKSHAGAILNAGGVPIATSGGSTTPSCTAVSGSGTGLSASYFIGTALAAPAALSRTDATVNFNWGSGSPGGAVPVDGFSARWSGQVSPRYTGPVTFYTTSDDGVRLWVNGQLLIDNWTDHGATENSGTITLVAGTSYDVKLEYYENTGNATITLSWSSSCEAKDIVPEAQLYPSAAAPSDPAEYNFESGAQGFAASTGSLGVSSSTAEAFAGTHALAVSFAAASGNELVELANPSIGAGATVTFHVWLPAGSGITSVQPFVLQGASGGWAWTGNWQPVGSLKAGQWNTIVVTVPSNAVTPLADVGVEFATSAPWTGTAYIDSVSY